MVDSIPARATMGGGGQSRRIMKLDPLDLLDPDETPRFVGLCSEGGEALSRREEERGVAARGLHDAISARANHPFRDV
jgi:hypothetical protein